MSLRRKAAATAVFGYLQLGVAAATGLVLVPLTLHSIGARTWGVWLVSGELVAYAGMADLGMLGVIQWMIAEAEGRGDREEIAKLVSQGVWIGGVFALLFASAALVLWRVLPSALFLSAADRRMIQGPLTATVVLTALSYPLLAYRALLVGTQDVAFFGVLSLINAVVSAGLTAAMLIAGYGLHALAWGGAAPSLAVAIVTAWRAARLHPEIAMRLSPPQLARVRFLLSHGFGSWLGTIGWQVLASSNAIVITYLGHAEWVPVYACTGKLVTLCLPLTWVLPDSGHVGLAQLYGQGNARARVRAVLLMMQRAHLVIAGAAACGLLAFNAAFVTRWVGPQMFGGVALNAVLAIGLIVHSFTHGLITSASIAGNRPRVGFVVLVNGAIHFALAVFLGHRFGLVGVAAASLVGVLVTQLPGSLALLQRTTDLRARAVFDELVSAWLPRALPLIALSMLVGRLYETLGIWWCGAAAATLCLAYVWHLRPLYAEGLPLDPQWTAWLRYWRLLPPPAAPIFEEVEAGR